MLFKQIALIVALAGLSMAEPNYGYAPPAASSPASPQQPEQPYAPAPAPSYPPTSNASPQQPSAPPAYGGQPQESAHPEQPESYSQTVIVAPIYESKAPSAAPSYSAAPQPSHSSSPEQPPAYGSPKPPQSSSSPEQPPKAYPSPKESPKAPAYPAPNPPKQTVPSPQQPTKPAYPAPVYPAPEETSTTTVYSTSTIKKPGPTITIPGDVATDCSATSKPAPTAGTPDAYPVKPAETVPSPEQPTSVSPAAPEYTVEYVTEYYTTTKCACPKPKKTKMVTVISTVTGSTSCPSSPAASSTPYAVPPASAPPAKPTMSSYPTEVPYPVAPEQYPSSTGRIYPPSNNSYPIYQPKTTPIQYTGAASAVAASSVFSLMVAAGAAYLLL